MLNDSRTSGSRPGGVLIPMPRAGLPAALNHGFAQSRPSPKPHQPPMPSRLRNVVRRYLPAAHAAHGCVAVVLCSVLVAACGKTDPALDNDAYVWQRRWTPAVTAAMTDSADLVRAWRVLAADVAPDGKWSDATPALPALAAAGRPAIMVLRFDGRVDGLRDAEIHARIAALRDSWQRAGIALAGVEIDYDCATSKLPAYTRFLAGLRARLDPSIPCTSPPCRPGWTSRARRPARHPRRKRAAGPCRAQSDARTVRCQARAGLAGRLRGADPQALARGPARLRQSRRLGRRGQDRSGRKRATRAHAWRTLGGAARDARRHGGLCLPHRRPAPARPGRHRLVPAADPCRRARLEPADVARRAGAPAAASGAVRQRAGRRRRRARPYSRTPAMPTPRSPSPCGWTAPAPPPTASTATRWNATD